MFGKKDKKDMRPQVNERVAITAETRRFVMPRNEVIFDGKIVSPIAETKRTQGLYSMKVEGQVNGSSCTIPVFVKNEFLADALACKERFALITLFGHLEFPMWEVRNGASYKSRLIFVADDIER